jgi:hypothetical protein
MEWLVPCRTVQGGRTDQVILMVAKSFDSQKIAGKQQPESSRDGCPKHT